MTQNDASEMEGTDPEPSPSPQPMRRERERDSRRGSITSKFTDYSDYYHVVTNTMRSDCGNAFGTGIGTGEGEAKQDMTATTPMESTLGSRSMDINPPNFDDDISRASYASHNTQLSYIEPDRGFNLFGWFSSNGSRNPNRFSNVMNKQGSDGSDHTRSPKKKPVKPKGIDVEMAKITPRKVLSHSEFGSDDEVENMNLEDRKENKAKPITPPPPKPKPKKKKSSKKKWRNLVKRKHQDSLTIPPNLVPVDKLHESKNKHSQFTSVRLDGLRMEQK